MVIGILVFTNQLKERIVKKKDRFFDGKRFFGLNYIISEIDKEHKIKYISSREDELNSVDFVLVSLTSYYDILNLINELRGKNVKSKVIVGGAGLLNFSLLARYIDIAVIGRGEGIINEIFEGKEFDNVWYKGRDPFIENTYRVGEPKFLIRYEEYVESGVGCSKRCYFCQYGWRIQGENGAEYNSDYIGGEDNIVNVDWNKRGVSNYLVSAIDGITERTRNVVNKQITRDDIENKLLEFYDCDRDYNAVKLYCIVGFPFEKSIILDEWQNIIKKVDRKSSKKLKIFLVSTHFCPMPLTPMENEKVNEYNFRNELLRNRYGYEGETIQYFWNGNQCTTPTTAMEECVLFRGDTTHLLKIGNIFLSSKYKRLKSYRKIDAIKEYLPHDLWGETETRKIIPYLVQPKGIDGAKERYNKKKRQCER